MRFAKGGSAGGDRLVQCVYLPLGAVSKSRLDYYALYYLLSLIVSLMATIVLMEKGFLIIDLHFPPFPHLPSTSAAQPCPPPRRDLFNTSVLSLGGPRWAMVELWGLPGPVGRAVLALKGPCSDNPPLSRF